jgi:hypothetical protein
LLITLINAQITLHSDSTLYDLKKDTLQIKGDNKDSIKAKNACEDIRVEQRQINNELKRQLEFLKNILEESGD